MTYTERQNEYINDIESGKVEVCRQVKQCYARHKRDLLRVNDSTFPYKFDESRGERVCRFIEMCVHTKDKWAKRKQHLLLENWQIAFVMTLFGWVDKKIG